MNQFVYHIVSCHEKEIFKCYLMTIGLLQVFRHTIVLVSRYHTKQYFALEFILLIVVMCWEVAKFIYQSGTA